MRHDAGARSWCGPRGHLDGLRLAADPRALVFLTVFGGLHGDVPLEPSAESFADVISDRGYRPCRRLAFRADADKALFSTDSARGYTFAGAGPRPCISPRRVQGFVPKPPTGRDATLHVYQRIAKLAAIRHGVSLISQRPQEVHKKVFNSRVAVEFS